MNISWKMKLSLFIDKYITGPLIAGLVYSFHLFFIFLDRVTKNQAAAISDREALDDYRKGTSLSKNKLPENLKELLPAAEKWGIGDDAIRGYVTDSASDQDKRDLAAALAGKLELIEQWLDSFPEGAMSDEAAAFMYMGEAIDEMALEIK